jgi:hypothetical protein
MYLEKFVSRAIILFHFILAPSGANIKKVATMAARLLPKQGGLHQARLEKPPHFHCQSKKNFPGASNLPGKF